MNQNLQSRCGLLTSWPLLMMIRAQQSLPAIVSGGKLDQADATVSQNWEFHQEIVWDGENWFLDLTLFLSFLAAWNPDQAVHFVRLWHLIKMIGLQNMLLDFVSIN